jgi:hypothetical protein
MHYCKGTLPANRTFGFQPQTFKTSQICSMEQSDNYIVFKNMCNMGDNSMPCTKVYHFQHLCLLMEQYIMWCVKLKLSLYLPWRHSKSGGTAPLILNLNKSKGEWANSYPNWFLPIIRWTRDWVGTTALSVCFREVENLLPRPGNETQHHPAHSLPIHCTDYTILIQPTWSIPDIKTNCWSETSLCVFTDSQFMNQRPESPHTTPRDKQYSRHYTTAWWELQFPLIKNLTLYVLFSGLSVKKIYICVNITPI